MAAWLPNCSDALLCCAACCRCSVQLPPSDPPACLPCPSVAPSPAAAAPAPEGPSWALWGPDGGLNLGLVAFVALAVACVAVWAAMVGQWTAYRW